MKTLTVLGAASVLTRAAGQQFVMYTPLGDDTSVQRSDPIISPGTISQHVHQIFGSNAFAPEVSYESLQSADCTTVADASDQGNAADNSIYWHPSLYMEARNGSGYIRVPTNGHKLYYKNAGTGTPRDPFEFPHGFRMIAGNPFLRAAPTNLQRQNITQWICHEENGMNQGTSGGFPTGVSNCPNVDGFNGAIHFPHCWNGQSFDPANPTAHIAYPVGDIEEGTCPSSHPTRLPHIFMENTFNLDQVHDLVKPDSFVLSMGDDTGYGWHADFFSGWKDGAIPALLSQCPQGEYGNEDVGTCPNFEPRSIPASKCKLKTSYRENVDNPGKNLPGCNPIVNTNPAPIFETAPLGVSTTDCKAVGNGSSGHPPSPPPSHTSAPKKSPAPTHSPSTGRPDSTPTPIASPKISCPASNDKLYKIRGKTFKIQCETDHVGGDLASKQVTNLYECIAACAKTKGCVDVSLSGVACYMKKSVGQKLVNTGVAGALLVDSTP